MNRYLLGTALTCILATGACDSVEMKERDAVKAQKQADEAKVAAEGRLDAARTQADIDVNKAQDEARRATDLAQQNADQHQNAADVTLMQTREAFVQSTEKALDGLEKRRRDVEARAKHGTAPQQAIVTASLKDVSEKEGSIRADLKLVSSASADTYDYAKSKVDRQLVDLKKAVDDLERRGT